MGFIYKIIELYHHQQSNEPPQVSLALSLIRTFFSLCTMSLPVLLSKAKGLSSFNAVCYSSLCIYIPHNKWYHLVLVILSFSLWLTLLSLILSTLYVKRKWMIWTFLSLHSIPYIVCHGFFNHSFVIKHLDCFHLLAMVPCIVYNNMHVHCKT